jgi:hypothetical protein
MNRVGKGPPEDHASAFRRQLEQWIAPLAEADQLRVLDWVDRALEANPDTVDHELIDGCIAGHIRITGVRDGAVLFAITEAGLADTLARAANDPRALNAELRRLGLKPLAPGSETPS